MDTNQLGLLSYMETQRVRQFFGYFSRSLLSPHYVLGTVLGLEI